MDYRTWIEQLAEADELFESQRYINKWYVLFVTTGREDIAAKDLMTVFEKGPIRPFVPTIETLFKKAGAIQHEISLMFPGYLFVETEMSNEEFTEKIANCVRASKHIHKQLNYGDRDDTALKDEERAVLESLWQNDNQNIKASMAVMVGDKLIITEGPLKGHEKKIKKLNRHKMKAVIEIELFGEQREATVGLGIIKKFPEGTELELEGK